MIAVQDLLARRKTSVQLNRNANGSNLTHDPATLKAALRDCFNNKRESEAPPKRTSSSLNRFASMTAISPDRPARNDNEFEP